MCYDLFLIHVRCGHLNSTVGQTVHCQSYAATGRACQNFAKKDGSLPRHGEYLLVTAADKLWIDGHVALKDSYAHSGKKDEPRFCRNCHKGYTEPLHRDEIRGKIQDPVCLGEWRELQRKDFQKQHVEREQELAWRQAKSEERGEGLKGGRREVGSISSSDRSP